MKPDTIIEDTGQITAGPLKFGNWYFQYGKTEGEVNMVKAIKRSNDIYFYRAGERLGCRYQNLLKIWFGKTTKFPLYNQKGSFHLHLEGGDSQRAGILRHLQSFHRTRLYAYNPNSNRTGNRSFCKRWKSGFLIKQDDIPNVQKCRCQMRPTNGTKE